MTAATFVHLRLHTEFSMIDGLARVKPLVKAVAEDGMPAVAITDQNNLCALVKFYNATRQAGIKPVVGADLWLDSEHNDVQPCRVTLLVMNRAGYANLTQLISQAYLEGQRQGRPIVQRKWLEQQNDGLIMLCGAREGDIGKALLSDEIDEAERLAQQWQCHYPERFYIELQRTGRETEDRYLHLAVALADKLALPVVATNDVRFLNTEDFEAHEARVCIHDSRTLDDPRRAHLYSDQQYLKSSAEMIELFADLPEAIENSVEIAKRCNLDIELGKNYLPNYPVPDGLTMDEFFRKISREGTEERLLRILDPQAENYAEHHKEYIDRLEFELDIIIQMGFPGYFLIVMDFIQWAKDNDVPVGPGRGSGAGSLVAYALKITDLDPLQYDLLFERFLNPERVSMPDFDVDFCMDGRDRVIDYVARTYGREAVSQIITFGTMAAKAVVRDVARVQGKPYGLADKLSKMIPFEVGMTLTKAMEDEEVLRNFVAENEEVAEIMEMAFKLEGITRNVGKHAGGVVISPTKLTDFSPLYCDETGANLVTQYDKDDVEKVGLVKFDFLGLRTLTIIDWAVKNINQLNENTDTAFLDITEIPLQDDAVFKLLQKGNTTAVFQLESRGMKDLIKRLLPSSFEDIIALVALFRPGPLQSGMVDDFINRKHGRSKVEHPHPELEPVLGNTYGVILYQEQVMQIAQVLANYSLGQADMLRRAMGKKKAEEMAKQRQFFSEGADKRGIDKQQAEYIFDLMEKFAGYGFNKSHSAAYALLSYQTAWLKHHYPAPFMAAVLSADMQNTDKVVILVEDCREMELPIVLPDVNVSAFKFTVDLNNQIVYGLGAIKGLGEGPVGAIIEARQQQGDFKDLFDFCSRVDLRRVNRRALDALIRSGAMDSLGAHRAALMACQDEAVKVAAQQVKNQDSGMVDLFGGMPGSEAAHNDDVYSRYATVKPWTDKIRLQAEKETLGLYLQGHPIDEYEAELRNIAKHPLAALQPDKREQKLAGLVVGLRTMKSKRGDTIAFVTLDDRTSRIEVSVFGETYEKYRHILMKDTVLVVEGEVSHDDYSGALKVRAKTLRDMDSARVAFAKELLITVDQNNCHQVNQQLAMLLTPYRSEGCPCVLNYTGLAATARLRFGEGWRITPSDELIASLQENLGESRVKLIY
jgi:DNA polymerase III subunit alpha